MTRVQVDIWSDYVCPFCYLEEPVVERISRAYGGLVDVRWRAFELRPEPFPTLPPNGAYLRDVWTRAVYPMAEDRNMTLKLPAIQPRSRLAHEAAQFAAEQGMFETMNMGLFRAFFEDGRDISNPEVLVDVGRCAGVNVKELPAALDEGRFRERVLADQSLAHDLGISGVPAMLLRPEGQPIERGIDLTGAEPFESINPLVRDLLEGRAGR